jgi:hypothetical protein
MRLKKVILGLAVLTLLVLMTSTALACEPPPPLEPGHSPGYWKHEIRAQLFHRGAKHYSPAAYWAIFDATGFSDPNLVYEWLWDKDYKYMWLDVANAFNAAAGLGPYNG